jgi:hypothetical protein
VTLRRIVFACLVAAVVVVSSAGPAASLLPAKVATGACQLLNRRAIESVFTAASVDRGPKPVKGPKSGDERFTRCEFDDHNTPDAGHQLNAYTFLAKGINRTQKRQLTTPQPGSTARELSADELAGIGSKGVMEVQPGGAYATVGALKGDNYFIVSVGYEGADPLPQITEAEILAVARLASKKA